jgi:hypothetical protein
MAESRSAKTKRWLRGDFTKGELQGMVAALVADQVIDVALGGKLSAMKKTALNRIVVPLMKRGTVAAGTTAGRLAMTGLRGAKMVAVSHPVLTAGTVAYVAYKNREEIGDLVEKGYEILQPVGQAVQEALPHVPRPGIGLPTGLRSDAMTTALTGLTRIRKPSKFNKAISKGMSIVKQSTSFGKKGVINSPKKAFKTVVSVASAVKKKKKMPKSGIRRKIYSALKRLLK